MRRGAPGPGASLPALGCGPGGINLRSLELDQSLSCLNQLGQVRLPLVEKPLQLRHFLRQLVGQADRFLDKFRGAIPLRKGRTDLRNGTLLRLLQRRCAR